jgi:predicted double-glycine peptidase
VRALIALCLLAVPVSLAGQALSQQTPSQGSGPVRSLLEIRQANVVIQKWDVSCGAAALASILTYQHGYPVSERNIAQNMLQRTDPMRVKYRGGFSLLDLKRYAESKGFKAAAYAGVQLPDLEKFGPAIVPIISHGYPHFVVFRQRIGGLVLLADPAFGNRSISEEEFGRVWQSNIAFVVRRRDARPAPNRLGAQQQDLLRTPSDAIRRALR